MKTIATSLTAAVAAATLALSAGAAQADLFQISMPLGGTSGTFYTQGAALADFMNSRTKVLRIVPRSEEHTSELQSLMRISYAVFCLKNKKAIANIHNTHTNTHTHNHKSDIILIIIATITTKIT